MGTKRFKVLRGAINYLKTSDDAPNPQAPSGTPLRAFQEVISGERNLSYDRRTDSLPEELLNAAVNPFGVDFDAANKYIVPLSKRVSDFSGISAARNAGNLLTTLPAEAQVVKGFEPAKAVVSVPDSSLDDNNALSQITNTRYKKKGARNYTFPIGAGSASDRVKGVQAGILAALPTGGNYSVSFKPEKI